MRIRILCIIVAAGVSIVSFMAFCRQPTQHQVVLVDMPYFTWTTYVQDPAFPIVFALPFLVIAGLVTTLQGLNFGRRQTSLLGLTQLTFWPVMAFVNGLAWPDNFAVIISGAVIFLYFYFSLRFFVRSLREKSKVPA